MAGFVLNDTCRCNLNTAEPYEIASTLQLMRCGQGE